MDDETAETARALIEQLHGLPVQEAVRIGEAADFVVQPHGPGAILTADFRPNRIRLTVVDGIVRSGSYG
ncbi:MAG: hypothetical protein WD794_03350 [Mycobacteriales bacterium]